MADDPYVLSRFADAQDAGGTYQRALGELRAGAKTSHWIWFVFPQLAGLGRSAMSQRFAISGLDEARAYLRHPVLGPRLRECAQVMASTTADATSVLGSVDAQKLRSSMTLFHRADPSAPEFTDVLRRHFENRTDGVTDAFLTGEGSAE